MATYKNDFTKKADYSLWELHEIRHQILEDTFLRNYKNINILGEKLYKEIKSIAEANFIS